MEDVKRTCELHWAQPLQNHKKAYTKSIFTRSLKASNIEDNDRR